MYVVISLVFKLCVAAAYPEASYELVDRAKLQENGINITSKTTKS